MRKVVIIDDEPWTRDVIKSLGEWSKLDLEVVGEAADGETGWSLIRNIMPDIVITDVRMPRINGLDLIAMMRNEGIESPAIVISGYDDYDYVHKALKLGVIDYLLKPIKPEDLNHQLENCITKIQNDSSLVQKSVHAKPLSDKLDKICLDILKELDIQLQLWKKDAVVESFQKLENAVVESEGEDLPQSIQIGIYYEVCSVLHKYINQMGLIENEDFTNQNTGYVFGRDNKFCDMITYLSECFLQTIDFAESLARKKNRVDTDVISKYLEEHYMGGITLEETADFFHISKEYLSKIFKTDQNVGFSDYILKLRMEKAKELIEVYNAPIKDVGSLVGYMDIAHFYKSFKRYFGITPGEMRDSLINDNKS